MVVTISLLLPIKTPFFQETFQARLDPEAEETDAEVGNPVHLGGWKQGWKKVIFEIPSNPSLEVFKARLDGALGNLD